MNQRKDRNDGIRIPFSRPSIGKRDLELVQTVLEGGWLAHGESNKIFEKNVSEYLGVEHAVSVNSCTSALLLSLIALGIKGEVLAPSFTWVATINAIVLAGATPVFVDIDPNTFTVSCADVEASITPKTEAIMVVHFGGLPADMPGIIDIANRYGLRVIEDSAECLGGSYFDTMTGVADIGCFSFFPTKNITTGEGGMVTTNDQAVAEKIRALAGHGITTSTWERQSARNKWHREATYIGYNFRMSNIVAAVGAAQMERIDEFLEARTRIADRYSELFRPVTQLKTQLVPESFKSSWQMYTICVSADLRNLIVSNLISDGIEASVHFDPPAHQQSIYHWVKSYRSLEYTHQVSKSIISLPIYSDMPLEWADEVASRVIHYLTT